MLFLFFKTQWYSPSKGDWTEIVKKDFEDFGIPCCFDYVSKYSTETFKDLVKSRAHEYSFSYLYSMKNKHKKMNSVDYDELKMQDYFKSNLFSKDQKKLIFKARTKMLQFGENYKGGEPYVLCPLCNQHIDHQELSFECPEVRKYINVVGSLRNLYSSEKIDVETVEALEKIMNYRNDNASTG